MRRLSAGLAHASLPGCAAVGAAAAAALSPAAAAHCAQRRFRTTSSSSSSSPATDAATDAPASAAPRSHHGSRADAAAEQGFLDRLKTLYRDFQLYRDRQLDKEAATEAQAGIDRFYEDNDGAPLTSAHTTASAGSSSGGAKRADSHRRRRSPLISRNPNICPRSVLFVPGSKPRVLAKIPSLPADCFILDLEDSVGVASKRQARENVRAFVEELQATHRQRRGAAAGAAPSGPGSCEGDGQAAGVDDDDYPRLVVRINSPDYDPATAMLDLELVGLLGPAVEGIALPKTTVRTYQLIKDYLYPDHQLWAFFESPRSVMQAPLICKQQVYQYAVMGYNDLSAELQLPMSGPPAMPLGAAAADGAVMSEAVNESLYITARLPLWQSTVQVLQAARSHHMFVIDAVFNDPTDKAGFRRNLHECRLLGLNGKTLIHPGQIEVTNAAFTPSEAEVVAAHRIVEAVQRAEGGVATVDGKMVEELHQRQARRVLDLQRNAELEKALVAQKRNEQEQPRRAAEEATAGESVAKDLGSGGDADAAAVEEPSRAPRRTPSRHRPLS